MKKVLIITYYWPPSGGAGVQRWVKLSKYLMEFGIKPFVLTVDENYASYMALDPSLNQEVNQNVTVYKTKSFEPINMYGRIVGKKNVPTAGFSNVNNKKFSQKLINALRSNFFIPDPRKGWNSYAYKKALKIIGNEKIDTVITTSPPHSTQLIGLKLKRKINISWIADFRDPWTDIYYYNILNHSIFSNLIDKNLEKKVLLESDKIITVSEGFKNLFEKKGLNIPSDKIAVIPNGYDPEDFSGNKNMANNKFIICYTGTISEQYNPHIFIDTLQEIIKEFPQTKIILQFVGIVFEELKNYIHQKGIAEHVEYIPTVSHEKSIGFINNSTALLLVIPDFHKSEGIVPGKLFEYLATRNPIICIGDPKSNAAKIISECEAGNTFDRGSGTKLKDYLTGLIKRFNEGSILKNNSPKIMNYSRQTQAEHYSSIIKSL